MAADCKSATQRVTEVRILPCAPFFDRRLGCAWHGRSDEWTRLAARMFVALLVLARLAAVGVAHHGAGQVSAADVGAAWVFCVSCGVGQTAFA